MEGSVDVYNYSVEYYWNLPEQLSGLLSVFLKLSSLSLNSRWNQIDTDESYNLYSSFFKGVFTLLVQFFWSGPKKKTIHLILVHLAFTLSFLKG